MTTPFRKIDGLQKCRHPLEIREKSAAHENFSASFFITAIFLSQRFKLGQVADWTGSLDSQGKTKKIGWLGL